MTFNAVNAVKHTFTQVLHGGRRSRVIPTTLEKAKTVVPVSSVAL